MFSCVENKSVIDKLKLKDVSKLIQQDSLYEWIIIEIDQHRSNFENNIVTMSKFKILSYSDYLDYKRKTSDSSFIYKIYDKADSLTQIDYNKKLQYYKPKIDSSIYAYRQLRDDHDPSKYFKIEFSSIEKERYTYSDDVKKINIKFKVTPLKGPINGGSFSYSIIPKVTNKEVADGGCRFSTYTSIDKVYTWEAPYDVKDEFEYATTEYIKDKYNFEFTYLTVRINDKTINALDEFTLIPLNYKIHLDQDSLSMFDYTYIMEEEFDVSLESSYEIAKSLMNIEKKKTNTLAYEFETILNNK